MSEQFISPSPAQPSVQFAQNNQPDLAQIAEFAKLALNVYRDQHQVTIPDNYQLLLDCPAHLRNDDYFACAHVVSLSENPQVINIIIAHRGTIFDIENWLDDIRIKLDKVPAAFYHSALPFTQQVTHIAQQHYPKAHIYYTHVGHSLGAIHAELCLAQQLLTQRFIQACTFESLGSLPLLKQQVKQGLLTKAAINQACHNVVIFNANVDAANTFNKQLNQPFHCHVGYGYPASDLLPTDRLYYTLDYSVDQHHMYKLLHYFNHGLEEPTRMHWPSGYEAGYEHYITYHYQPHYWDQVIAKYWQSHPIQQANYGDNYDLFYKLIKHRDLK